MGRGASKQTDPEEKQLKKYYKCPRCGLEMYESEIWDGECRKCGGTNLKEIGVYATPQDIKEYLDEFDKYKIEFQFEANKKGKNTLLDLIKDFLKQQQIKYTNLRITPLQKS